MRYPQVDIRDELKRDEKCVESGLEASRVVTAGRSGVGVTNLA